MSETLLKQIAECLENGDDERTGVLTREAVGEGIPPRRILDEGLLAGMNVVGERFKSHEIFLPDVLLAARAMYAGMDVLKPLLLSEGVASRGKIIIGTVYGDLHDIGKNLVGILLRGAGFDVIDLGNSVPPEAFVEAARKEQATLIGMSALLTTTMPMMKRVIDLLKEQGLAGQVRTVIGGAPVSDAYAKEIGADGYGYDGASAVDRVKALMGVR